MTIITISSSVVISRKSPAMKEQPVSQPASQSNQVTGYTNERNINDFLILFPLKTIGYSGVASGLDQSYESSYTISVN